MKRFLFLNLLFLFPSTFQAAVDPEAHKLCLKASDYKGCLEAQYENKSKKDYENTNKTISVPVPSPHSFESWSVKQLKVRDRYGRYITFVGRTPNVFGGSSGIYLPGSPGTTSCNTIGSYTSCSTTGYIAPTSIPGQPGGVQNKQFVYELDCQDMTFDRKGDLKNANGDKWGWLDVIQDPTARAVADKYCPIIHTLPLYEKQKKKRTKPPACLTGKLSPNNPRCREKND